MAKRKWSWKHRLFIGTLVSVPAFKKVLDVCEDRFGPYKHDISDRWDYTALRRRNRYNQYGYCYYNVQLFFKHQEDAVLFKLSYDSSVLDG